MAAQGRIAMRSTGSVPRKDSWLSRQPALLSTWLAARNALHRSLTTSSGMALGTLAIAGTALAIWLASTFSHRLEAFIQFGIAYIGFVPIIAALHAATLVSRRRRHLREQHLRSWLIATVQGFAGSRRAILIGTLASVLMHGLAVALTLIIAGILSRTEFADAMQLLVYAVGGLVVGALAGWYLPSMQRRATNEASRYVPKPATGNGLQPRAAALSRWPIAQTLAWNRPENSRIVILVALLSVQAGASIFGGLSVVAAWVIGAYLVGLLRGIVCVGREAAQWLRSTPIAFATFAWSVARRALVHQIIGTAVGAAVITILGSPVSMTLYLAGLWLSVVVMVSAVSLAESYRSRSPALKLALSFAAIVGIESRAHGWAIPFALGLTVWHLRQGARS
jgi:hypothetical protein